MEYHNFNFNIECDTNNYNEELVKFLKELSENKIKFIKTSDRTLKVHTDPEEMTKFLEISTKNKVILW